MFKLFARYLIFAGLGFATAKASENAVVEFDRSWSNPDYIQYQAEDIDINSIVETNPKYRDMQKLSGAQLWEAEKNKAHDPKKYIPHVVKTGIAEVYGEQIISPNETMFMRFSEQKSWKNPEVIANVLEEVHIFEAEKRVIFLGRSLETLAPHVQMKSHVNQHLFHVEHSVGGNENSPVNLWRIVFLTANQEYKQSVFTHLNAMPKNVVPRFVEVYAQEKGLLQ